MPPPAKDLLALLFHATVSVAAIALALGTVATAEAQGKAADLPELGFREVPHRQHKVMPHVIATFPSVPGSKCESWCYESNTYFLGCKELDEGRLELRHRDGNRQHVIYVTTVTPEPGAVRFEARAEVDKKRDPDGKLPANLQSLNMCFQLRETESFRSKPEPYPEFVKRCFIFTDKGRTFLLDTSRRKILHRWPADHEYNNPPWVQMYVGVWRPAPAVQGSGWAEYSTDRYTVPVVGAVSRDAKYLAALANDSADTLCQAWHDCLHNNPKWLPADAPPEDQRWRVKLYVMENDPEALLARVAKELPDAMKLQEKRVPQE